MAAAQDYRTSSARDAEREQRMAQAEDLASSESINQLLQIRQAQGGNLQALQDLANKEQPTRREWESAGLPLSGPWKSALPLRISSASRSEASRIWARA